MSISGMPNFSEESPDNYLQNKPSSSSYSGQKNLDALVD